jgi:hypothetical protein
MRGKEGGFGGFRELCLVGGRVKVEKKEVGKIMVKE